MKKILFITILLFLLFIFILLLQKKTLHFLEKEKEDILLDKYFPKYFPNVLNKVIKRDDVIFVSIASYRDSQLNSTVKSILDNCYNLKNIKIVICEQNDENDDFHLNINHPCIELIKMSHKDARGPCYARYLIQQKWNGEQYYLQIDSHTRFVKNWDVKLKEQLSLLPIKSCLSNYVSTYDINTGLVLKSPLRGPMFITEQNSKDKTFRFNSKYVTSMKKPLKSNGWSGCFSFSSSQIIIDVPYDPYLPFLFFGEEMDVYLRLKKKNWNLYVPSIPICFTLFDRSYRKTFWEHPDNKIILPYSKQRLYYKFGWVTTVDPRLTYDITIY